MTISHYKDKFTIEDFEAERNALASKARRTRVERNRLHYLRNRERYYCNPVACICGSIVTQCHMNRHLLSLKHRHFTQDNSESLSLME